MRLQEGDNQFSAEYGRQAPESKLATQVKLIAKDALVVAPDIASRIFDMPIEQLPQPVDFEVITGERSSEETSDFIRKPFSFPLLTLSCLDEIRLNIYFSASAGRALSDSNLEDYFPKMVGQIKNRGEKAQIVVSLKQVQEFWRELREIQNPNLEGAGLMTKMHIVMTIFHEYMHKVLSKPNTMPDNLKAAILQQVRQVLMSITSLRYPQNYSFINGQGKSIYRQDLVQRLIEMIPRENVNLGRYSFVPINGIRWLIEDSEIADGENKPTKLVVIGQEVDESITEGLAMEIFQAFLREKLNWPTDTIEIAKKLFFHCKQLPYQALLYFCQNSPVELIKAIRNGELYQQIVSSLELRFLDDFASALIPTYQKGRDSAELLMQVLEATKNARLKSYNIP